MYRIRFKTDLEMSTITQSDKTCRRLVEILIQAGATHLEVLDLTLKKPEDVLDFMVPDRELPDQDLWDWAVQMHGAAPIMGPTGLEGYRLPWLKEGDWQMEGERFMPPITKRAGSRDVFPLTRAVRLAIRLRMVWHEKHGRTCDPRRTEVDSAAPIG